MLRTPLCDRLGIEAPIVGAPFGPWEQVGLAAAICELGRSGASAPRCGASTSCARKGGACPG